MERGGFHGPVRLVLPNLSRKVGVWGMAVAVLLRQLAGTGLGLGLRLRCRCRACAQVVAHDVLPRAKEAAAENTKGYDNNNDNSNGH